MIIHTQQELLRLRLGKTAVSGNCPVCGEFVSDSSFPIVVTNATDKWFSAFHPQCAERLAWQIINEIQGLPR